MYTKQSKKMLPFDVLNILQRYTDVNHRLSQKDIEEILKDKYDMVVDRRSIKRSIMDLIEMGLEIQYNEIIRIVTDKFTGEKEEQYILTDFYLEREFSDCEIRLLIDEVLDNKFVPYKQRQQLISKLEGLTSVYFRRRNGGPGEQGVENVNNQLFYTLDIVDEAISECSKVSFRYKYFKAGKSGSIEVDYDTYIVIPHDMKVVDGEYLLVCSEDGYTEMTLSINYISDITIVNESGYRRSNNNILGANKEREITFVASEDTLYTFVEKFGQHSIRVKYSQGQLILKVRTSEKKAVDFGFKHANDVVVVSPESVRYAIVDKLQIGIDSYLKNCV